VGRSRGKTAQEVVRGERRSKKRKKEANPAVFKSRFERGVPTLSTERKEGQFTGMSIPGRVGKERVRKTQRTCISLRGG